MKRIMWKQLGDIRDKRILDFGSGIGVTANYLAEHNDVTAIEPNEESVDAMDRQPVYTNYRTFWDMQQNQENNKFL